LNHFTFSAFFRFQSLEKLDFHYPSRHLGWQAEGKSLRLKAILERNAMRNFAISRATFSLDETHRFHLSHSFLLGFLSFLLFQFTLPENYIYDGNLASTLSGERARLRLGSIGMKRERNLLAMGRLPNYLD
jgi:hypothetical protein